MLILRLSECLCARVVWRIALSSTSTLCRIPVCFGRRLYRQWAASLDTRQWQCFHCPFLRMSEYVWGVRNTLQVLLCMCIVTFKYARDCGAREGLSVASVYDTRYYFRYYFTVQLKAKTWVSLIYDTEPTTKKCKAEKLKSNKRICSEVTVNSLGNPCSQSWRRKGRLRWEGFAEKEGSKPGMKEWGVMEY